MRAALLLLGVAVCVWAQDEPPAFAGRGGRGGRGNTREFLGLGRAPDAAVAARGEKLYTPNCGFCHGADARGAEAPSLVRSEVVLHDDRGETIGPVLLKGRPDRGMPTFPNLTPQQISEIAEFLHLKVEMAANRGMYGSVFKERNIVTGDAKAGAAYFESNCKSCHSASGDLAHVGARMDPVNLQNRWLWPRIARTNATVTLASGEKVSGTVRRIDDFDISITDAAGNYRTWSRDEVKVEIADPLAGHRNLLDRYTDADIHNVTAYLVTLR
jgi:cytochrome c oxidase cbb3-type subunit III